MQRGKRTLAGDDFRNPGPPPPDAVWHLSPGQQQMANTLRARLHLLLEHCSYAGVVAAKCRGTIMILHICFDPSELNSACVPLLAPSK